ncbi:MAG: bifunctional (p)ppGpp synthetase/guanosine-3',5'-bis(diphosphate) 3'-pyrophosphohydrolase [Thermoleophilaceae bacterium]|nr:bifunctional (p)ppGpp synthetase/guanosine-3',5'-bis(diphosphate) 3'-pyrophosphohydrolase [Thermoleophilaceae bacterium]
MPGVVGPSFLCDLALTCEAVEFAAEHHAGQERAADRAAFLVHPVEVAWLLHSSGYPDPVVAAAVLHDVVEDTDADLPELRERFGDEVAELVAVLTEDPGITDWAARKRDLRNRLLDSREEAAAIFAADKVSKVRELRALVGLRELSLAELRDRLDHYRRSLDVLERVLGPGDRLVGDLRFELEALLALPPGGTAEVLAEVAR